MAQIDLEQYQDNLKSLNEILNAQIAQIGQAFGNSLQKSISEAKKLAEQFEKNVDITKDLNKQARKLSDENEKLSLKEIILRKKLDQAIISHNANLEKKLSKQLLGTIQARKLNEQLDAELRKLKLANDERKKANDLGTVLGKNIKDAFKPFLETLTLIGIFKVLIDSAFRFNKTSVEIGKNFGYGVDNSNRLTSNLVRMERRSANINVNIKNLSDAMNELMASTGFVSEYSSNTLETQIMLTKQLGLTGDEAAGIYKYSVLTNKSSKETYLQFKNSFVALRNQLGVGIPFKSTMAEAAKVSGQLAANLGYNPEKIMKAVIATKALGTTLEQTKIQGEALLDFESSIENVLKSELLTGQHLNLERARALALQGDIRGVAEELANQGMTILKFSQLNVLAQKSYAAALGLSTDQLSEQLKNRELAIASGKSLAQIDAEQAEQAARRQDIQTKFNAAVDKMKSIIGDLVAGPLGKFLEMMTNILSNAYILYPIIGGITGLIAGKMVVGIINFGKGLAAAIPRMASLLSLSQAKAVAEITAAEAISFGLATVGIIAGIAAAVSAMKSSQSEMKSMQDGVIGPSGKILYTEKEGAIKLNDDDSIVVGTNLRNKKSEKIDMSPMISAINDLKNLFKESSLKPAVAYIQGERPFANLLGKQSQLFTSGMQNQSKLA